MSEQLSEHFSRAEFERDGPMPDGAPVDAYRVLSVQILEPVRAHAGAPLEITSGYRSPGANAAAHGVTHSQHLATGACCAADFAIAGVTDLRSLFDWIRMESGLPFDQVILEHSERADIIHISWAAGFQRRQALEGATHNRTPYKRWPSVINPNANA